MTCRRAFEADLAAVLHGGDGDAEADFRAHYPGCPACAAEVQVWRELDATLRAGFPRAEMHPDPDTVLAYVDAPAALAADAREAMERHLATCRRCADEARTLRRVDLGRLVASDDPDAASRRPARAIARVLWHPAFAYALVVALLLPILRDQLGPGAESPRVAETRPAPHPQPAAPAGDHDAPAFSARAAETSAPVLALGTGDPAVVPYATARQRGIVLRITPPASLVPGPVDVRVRSRVGGRELVTRVADRADAMAVTIPRRWLTPGDYEVTLTPAAQSGAAAPPGAGAAARALPGAPSAGRAPRDEAPGVAPLVFTVAPPAGEAARR